ncbi:MAG TPA: serine hydrolase domain-containing protein [Pirellulales bacterium]|nr:serine hydrolase domain-containing protein [Pirellulales bacterium]
MPAPGKSRRSVILPRFFCSAICVAWFIALSAMAAPPKFDAEKLAAIGPGMQHFVDQGDIAGAVLVIGTSDGIVYHEAIGKQSLETGQLMPKDAIFRIMSMTKPITAMGLMLLRDESKLSIDDPVEKYLPEFKGQMVVAATDKDAGTVTLKKPDRPITLKDLLTHTAGQPEYPEGLAALRRTRDHTLAEVALISSQRPLEFGPGSQWKYSSAGIDVLGRIIEVVSGQAYEDFLQERFFAPLEMHDTAFYLTPQQAQRLAEIYGIKNGKLTPASQLPDYRAANPTLKPKYPAPAAGLYSTGADLARLYQALLNGGQLNGQRIIAEKTLHEMTQNQTGDLKAGFVPGSAWGLGFSLVEHPDGVTEMLSPGTFGHGGAYGTQGWIDPEKDVFLIMLIQRSGLKNSDGSDMRREFQALAMQAIQP